MLNRQAREELNQLSKEVFGSSSRWQKLIYKGYPKLLTETTTEYVPDENGGEGTSREVEVPVLRADGARQYKTEHHTVESIRELMTGMKAKRDAWLAEIERLRVEEEAKKAQEELNKKVNQELMGSALT